MQYNPEKMTDPTTDQTAILNMFANVGDSLDIPLCDASKFIYESLQNEDKDVRTKRKCI